MFHALILLSLFLLHADQLGVEVASYNIRVGNLSSILLLVSLLYRSRGLVSIQRNRLTISFLIVSFTCISSMWSPDPLRTIAMTGLAAITLVTCFFLPYLLVDCLGPLRVLRDYMWAGAIVGLYALFQTLFSVFGFHDFFANQVLSNGIVRGNAFAYEPSFYVLYMTPILCVSIGAYMIGPVAGVKKSISLVIAYFVMCAVSISASIIFVPALSAIAVMSLMWIAGGNKCRLGARKMGNRFLLILTAFSFVVGILSFAYSDFLNDYLFRVFLADDISQHHSTTERVVQTLNSFVAFLDAPVIGQGLGGVGQYLYDQYLGGRELLFSPSRPFDADPVPKFFEPMNVTTELLASYGIIGSIIYLSLFFIVIKDAVRFLTNSSAPPPIIRLVYVLLVAVVVMIIWQNVNQGLFRTYTWFFIGMVDAIRLSFENSSQFLSKGMKSDYAIK